IYTALSTAARGEQAAGDSRTADQLRADVLAQLLMGGLGSAPSRARSGAGSGAGGGASGRAAGGAGSGSAEADPDGSTVLPRAEIMVLINAETLFGANEEPAELHGYGPISAEEARRLARNAAGWTGLAQDPKTGEILGVGRRRKVPAGLARWLRARDGTCRFPGCRVSTAVTEIDHTIDWADGGPTDHGNLEHLCRRHHRFKTRGFWKASQPTPGVMEWTSPTGRVYRTEPFLELAPR
ncbi:HNH endonuclease, partial [Arthrobacter sp. zg-Y20]